MIARMGYPSETHTVVTDDCYILEMHRIPHGKSKTRADMGQPILLVHGVLGSSADWVMGIPEKSLGKTLCISGQFLELNITYESINNGSLFNSMYKKLWDQFCRGQKTKFHPEI